MMLNQKRFKTIIVTDSNKGIGFGIANHLAKSHEWNVVLTYRNNELGEKAKTQILTKNPDANLHLEKLDISDSKSVDNFVDIIKHKYNSIHALVNNAGILGKVNSICLEEIKKINATVLNF